MKKVLIWLGVMFFVLVVAITALAYNGYRKYGEVAADAGPYVDEVVMAVTAEWRADELLVRFTPQVRATTRAEDIEALFHLADQGLGELVDYPGGKLLTWNTNATVGQEIVTTAEFVAQARFERGVADLAIVLQKVDGDWRVRHFAINSSDLVQHAAGAKI